jgi:pimeloyl-ACP methyl ester carboxylesterase
VLSSFLAIVLVAAIGFPAALYFLQDRLLFFPQPLPEARRAQIIQRFRSVREVFIQGEDQKRLQAWHVPAAPGAPLILYFGGNAEDVSGMIEEAMSRVPGVGWLLVSYRGYGGSEGAPSEAAISADALLWHDHAVREIKPGKVVVFGRSLGTGAAVFLASQRKIDAAILVTPYDSMVAVARHHYPLVPIGWLLKHRFDSAQRAPGISAPLLCIAAGQDEVIPVAHARRLFDAWGGPKRWIEIENAGHNSTDGAPVFWQSITAFLEKSA